MRTWFALALALVAATPAFAQDAGPASAPPGAAPAAPAPVPPEAVADRVVAAFEAKDEARLRSLASADAPDPWLVADELVRRGALDAAAAFAGAAPRPDVEGLTAYVAGRRGREEDPVRRRAVVEGNAALAAGRAQDALAATEAAPSGAADDVLAVRRLGLRGAAMATLGRGADATASFAEAAEAAERLGWLARAAVLLEQAARVALGEGRAADAAPRLERLVAVARRRRDARGEASALSGLAFAATRTGDVKAAVAALERAVDAWQAAGDAREALAARLELGERLVEAGEAALAVTTLEGAVAAAQAVGVREALGQALLGLAHARSAAGDLPGAVAGWERALTEFEAVGDVAGQAAAAINLGAAFADGPLRDDERAARHLEQGIAAAVTAGDPEGERIASRQLGRLRASLGEREAARAAFAREIELSERVGEAALAASLIDAGTRLARPPSFDGATATAWLERGRALAERLGQRRWMVNATVGLADVARESGRLGDAEAAFRRAAQLAEEAGEVGARGGALVGLADLAVRRGELDAALTLVREALAAAEKAGAPTVAAGAHEQAARAHEARRAYPEAVSAFQRAIEAAEPLGDTRRTSDLLRGLGNVLLTHADFARALAAFQRALALDEARKDRASQAESLLGIGVAQNNLGAYARAFEATERAHALQLALGDRRGAAMTLCNLGVLSWALGDVAKALDAYERALAEHRAVGDRTSEATTLGNVAAARERLGDAKAAIPLHEQALAAWERLGDPAGAARARLNLGTAIAATGERERGLATCEKALAELEAAGDRRGAAWAVARIGDLQRDLGNLPKAVASYERAARAAEKLGLQAVLVGALEDLALARLELGDPGRALAEAHRAVELLKRLVGGLGEQQGTSARSEHARLFSTGVRAAARLDDVAEAVFFLESGRAGSLLESLGARDQLRRTSLPPELRAAEAEARAAEARALVAYTQALEAGDRATVRARSADLASARAQVGEVAERSERETKRDAQLPYPVATPVEDVQRLLADGDVLVLFGLAEPQAEAHAVVLTRAEARIVALGPTQAVLDACEALDASDPDADPTPALARLRALLVEPLGLPLATRRLLVSPDGPLGYVPFAALVPGLDVAFEASGSAYGVLLDDHADPGEKVLALADPDYAAKFDAKALELYAPERGAGAPAATRGPRLVPLPGTRAEADAVADVKLLGKDACEAGLHAALASTGARWRAVHFACHGLVDPERPALSSLALTPDAGNDGFLTALEVLRLRIRADLVVLSACETGKGKIVSGEGIVGLTRSFTFAGSPRVLCSLWKVDDEATSALMRKFYELWNPRTGSKGMGTAAALRAAQEHVRSQEKWKHPYYWAAWVLWGLPS